MKQIITILSLIFFIQSCTQKGENKSENTQIENDKVEKTFISVEILKREKVAEPTKLFYYFVERNSENKIIDSTLLMTPTCYDYRVKDVLWSKDSSIIAFESLERIDGGQHLEIFYTKKKEKVFSTAGHIFPSYAKTKCESTDEDLNQILFYNLKREKNSDKAKLSILVLNTAGMTVDTLKTVDTRVDIWYLPGLVNSDWTNKEFQVVHTPEYDNGMYKRDTLSISL